MGGCADPNFKDLKSLQHLRSCCYGPGSLDRGLPSNNETSQVFAPQQIPSPPTTSSTVTSTPSTSASSITSSTILASSIAVLGTPTATAASSPPSSSDLSVGAQAGLGVGVSIADLVFLVGLVSFFCLGRRRATNGQKINEAPTETAWKERGDHYTCHQPAVDTMGAPWDRRKHKLDNPTTQPRRKLDGTARSELQGESSRS